MVAEKRKQGQHAACPACTSVCRLPHQLALVQSSSRVSEQHVCHSIAGCLPAAPDRLHAAACKIKTSMARAAAVGICCHQIRAPDSAFRQLRRPCYQETSTDHARSTKQRAVEPWPARRKQRHTHVPHLCTRRRRAPGAVLAGRASQCRAAGWQKRGPSAAHAHTAARAARPKGRVNKAGCVGGCAAVRLVCSEHWLWCGLHSRLAQQAPALQLHT